MRRIYAAFGILALILALTVYSSHLVHSTTEALCSQLSQIEQACAAGRYEAARAGVRQLTSFYTRQEPKLALFIKRDFLSAASGALAGLEAYVSEASLPDLQSELHKARTQIEAIEGLFFGVL